MTSNERMREQSLASLGEFYVEDVGGWAAGQIRAAARSTWPAPVGRSI